MRAELLRARELLLARGDAATEDDLYAAWYHSPGGGLRAYPEPQAYRAATLDPARLEAGWTVRAVAPGAAAAVVAVRDGDERVVAPPDCAPASADCLAMRPGVALRVDPLAAGYHGGFWHLWSPAWRRSGPPPRLRRLYLAMRPGCELGFAARAVGAAPVDGAWSIKFLSGGHVEGRRDPAVLYVGEGEDLGAGWIAALIAATAGLRAGAPPPLTLPVAEGVGLAPDPGDGASFGQAVCRRLLAAAAVPGALRDEAAWLAAAAERLRDLAPAADAP